MFEARYDHFSNFFWEGVLSNYSGRILDPTAYGLVSNTASWRQMGTFSFGQCQWMILRDLSHCKWVVPQRCPLSDVQLNNLQRSLESAVHFLSIPLIVTSNRWLETSHIVHLLVNKKMNQIEYYDPRGVEMRTYPAVEAVYRILKNDKTELIQNDQRLQYWVDCINCGPLVLLYLDQRIGRGIPMADLSYPPKGIFHFRQQLALRLADASLPKSKEEWQEVDRDDFSSKPLSEPQQ